MSNIKTKIFTCLLSATMAVVSMPVVTAYAAELDNSNIKIENAAITAFGRCGKNLNWKIEGNKLIISGKGAMYDYSYENAPWDKYDKNILHIVIQNGITSIGTYAFAGLGGYVGIDVTFSKVTTLKTIRAHAFQSSLIQSSTLVIPNGVTAIGSYAFEGDCIPTLKLPTSLKTIGAHAFENVYWLKSVNIPKNVTSIGDYAFADIKYCEDDSIFSSDGLTRVTGGAGLKTIGKCAFKGCNRLTAFKITSKKLSKIGASAFSGCKKLTTLNLPNTIKLTKSGVKGSLKGSSIKTVKAKYFKVKYYRKYFSKSNSGRKVMVKKA